MEMLSIPIIATLVFCLLEMLKASFKNKPNFTNFLPLIAGGLGGALGLVAFFFAPTIIATSNIFHAVLVGILSGLSATGSHQLVAQIIKRNEAKKEDSTDNENK